MNNNKYEVNVSVEPTDKYEKARNDIIQAIKSMQELLPPQREQLAKELFGAEAVAFIQKIMQHRNQKIW